MEATGLDKLSNQIDQLSRQHQVVKVDQSSPVQLNSQEVLDKFGLVSSEIYEEAKPWWVSLPFGKLIKLRRDKSGKKKLGVKFENEYQEELSKTEALVNHCRKKGLSTPAQWLEYKLPVQHQIDLLYIASVNLSTYKIMALSKEFSNLQTKSGH